MEHNWHPFGARKTRLNIWNTFGTYLERIEHIWNTFGTHGAHCGTLGSTCGRQLRVPRHCLSTFVVWGANFRENSCGRQLRGPRHFFSTFAVSGIGCKGWANRLPRCGVTGSPAEGNRFLFLTVGTPKASLVGE